MLQEGTRLNDTYTLLEQIGTGGGGIVYKAYHERLQTYVVVKQIRDRVKGILESRAEADILKNIKHTCLPCVYDFLEIDGEVFTVMDYIPGMSLAQALEQEGRFSQKEVYQWALQLADALNYLHTQNPPVIHSDIKPANIMLTPERKICLIDFNVSLAFDQGMRTSTGVSKGYSPPEQYRDMYSYQKDTFYSKKNAACEAANTLEGAQDTVIMGNEGTVATETESLVAGMVGRGVDERSDVYSLGATLYHLLTGIRPSKIYEEILPITEYDLELNEGLGFIINKMMEINPERRYQNGKELLFALEHIYELDSEYQAYKRTQRNKRFLAGALFVTGAALAATGHLTMKREVVTAYNRTIENAESRIEEADYTQAEKAISQAFSLLPGRIDAYEKEVLLLYSQGNYEEAVRYGKDVVKNPAYVLDGQEEQKLLGNIFYIMANSYFEQEDYQNALACFEEALEENQDNSLYFRDYAITLGKTGNISEAEAALKSAIALGLGEDSVYMTQGELAFAKGENEQAVEYLKQSIQTAASPDLKRRAVLLCAQAFQRLGSEYLEQEIEILEENKSTAGTTASLHLLEQLADAYARKEDYPKALELFYQLYEQGYSSRQTMENLAILYQQTGDLGQAEHMLNQIIEKYPDDYRAYKRLAFLEADKQQKKENAERDYQVMKEDYEEAVRLYGESGQNGDTEMLMLENMMKDLKDGGWF